MGSLSTTLARLAQKPAAVMGAGRLGVAVLGLASTPILTRQLTPAEYGTFALFIAVASIASTVPTTWLTSATLRYGGNLPMTELHRTVLRGTYYSILAVALLAAAGAILALPLSPVLVGGTILYAALESVFSSIWVTKRTQLAAWSFTIAGLVRNAVPIALFLVLALAGALTLQTVIASMALGSLLAILSMWTVRRKPLLADGAIDLRVWFKFGRPLIANYALGLLLIHANRFVILALVGVEAVAVYAPTAELIVTAVTLLTALVGLAAVPMIFSAAPGSERDLLLHQLRFRVRATTAVVALALAAAWPALSSLLIGEDLRVESGWTVVSLVLSAALMAYRFQYLNIRLQLILATRVQTVGTLVALLVNVVLGLVLIPSFEILGAALATLFASACANVWISVYLWKCSRGEPHAQND